MKKDTETMALPLLALETGTKQGRGDGKPPPWETLPPEVKEIILKEVFNGKDVCDADVEKFCSTNKAYNDLVCNNESFWHAQCKKRGWDREDRTTGYHKMEDGKWRAQFWKWCELRLDDNNLKDTVEQLILWLNLGTPLDFTGEWPGWANKETLEPPPGSLDTVKFAWLEVKKYGPIETWDTSKVTDMRNLFSNRVKFNRDISKWDVSNVKYMDGMFNNARQFNQNLNSWNVSNNRGASKMFSNASSFNNGQSATESTNPLTWDVSSLEFANFMFSGAETFIQDLRNKEGNGPWYAPLLKSAFKMFDESGLAAAGRIPEWWRGDDERPVFEAPPSLVR